MAGRNRKKYKTTGYMVPAPFAVVMVLASTLSLSYLWLESRCEAIGKELKNLETISKDLHRKCLYEESRWASMKAPLEIEKALRRHNLVISWPGKDQIVRMISSDITAALAEAAPQRPPQYVQIPRTPMND